MAPVQTKSSFLGPGLGWYIALFESRGPGWHEERIMKSASVELMWISSVGNVPTAVLRRKSTATSSPAVGCNFKPARQRDHGSLCNGIQHQAVTAVCRVERQLPSTPALTPSSEDPRHFEQSLAHFHGQACRQPSGISCSSSIWNTFRFAKVVLCRFRAKSR